MRREAVFRLSSFRRHVGTSTPLRTRKTKLPTYYDPEQVCTSTNVHASTTLLQLHIRCHFLKRAPYRESTSYSRVNICSGVRYLNLKPASRITEEIAKKLQQPFFATTHIHVRNISRRTNATMEREPLRITLTPTKFKLVRKDAGHPNPNQADSFDPSRYTADVR